MTEYGVVSKVLVRRLIDIAGRGAVLSGDDVEQDYAQDEGRGCSCLPDLVVKPANASDVAAVLALANEACVPVTPRGGGTGLSGGAVAVRGGIVLSLEKMSRIKEIDDRNFAAVVEPGVKLKDLYVALEGRGMCYPLYPGEHSAHIGGNVATNAGGMRAMKYGTTKDWVLGLEMALPTGELIRTGGKYVKSSTGYNLAHLVVGSEGTLAVVTEVILRLTTPPGFTEVFLIPFPALEKAIEAVPALLKDRVPLAGLEFLERDAVLIMEEHSRYRFPLREHPSFLLGILEGDSLDDIMSAAGFASRVCAQFGALDTYVAGSDKARRELLEARGSLFHALKRSGPTAIADVVVPPSRIAEFVGAVREISNRIGVPILAYGHAGDGNVHLHPMGRGLTPEAWEERLPKVMEEMYRVGVAMGGTISGEHGLGADKSKYLGLGIPPEQVELMKRIKAAFDPNNILNPGKIFL
ncbi:MAG: FAD-binding oxidoreductase [Dehalococcoidia bacterium]|nr:FAD-binding oxidoreductase [Dehalococcoidia bacterium]